MICPFCQKQLDAPSMFCPACGQEVLIESNSVDLSSFWDAAIKKNVEFEQECRVIAKQRIKDAQARQYKAIFVVVIMAIVMACIGLGLNFFYVVLPKRSLLRATVGSYVRFGVYEQDNASYNGKESIEWLTLAREGDKILVISKYALDYIPYSNTYSDWETSSIREWLNGYFFTNAFNTDEQKRIQSCNIKAVNNPNYDTPAGNDTIDKVFLLSINEAMEYFDSSELRQGVPTKYVADTGTTRNNSTMWWLRTPGFNMGDAAYVKYDGNISYEGTATVNRYTCVRPVLWISVKD